MKKRLLLVCSLLLLLLMGACGNQGGQTAFGHEKQAKTEEKETRTYKMVNGKEVEIPKNPKRIVTDLYLGEILALGKKPVGATDYELKNPFLTKDQLSGIKDIGTPISLEKVTELNPDLIITSDSEIYDKLSKIAPTVLIPYGTYNNDVREDIRAFGNLLGKKKEAEEWIKRFEKKAEKAREKIAGVIGKDETVGIYELHSKDFYVLGANWGRGGQVLYNALQLNPPKKVKEMVKKGTPPKQISLEVLPEYAADHMFFTVYDTEDSVINEMKNSPIFKNLDAVKNGHFYEMDLDKMYYYDPIAIEGQIDIIVDTLLSHSQK